MFAYCGNNPVFRIDADGEAWNVLIGAAVGAVVGGAGQLVSDLTTSIMLGQWQFSNWQTYTGAVVGGVAGGAILGGTGNVNLANAVTGFVTTGLGYTLEKATRVSNLSWGEIAVSATLDGVISQQLGTIPVKKGITHGRNSMAAVYKAGLTKLRNNTATKMSMNVVGKGLTSSFVGSLAMDVYYGKKQYTIINSGVQYKYDRLSRSYVRC